MSAVSESLSTASVRYICYLGSFVCIVSGSFISDAVKRNASSEKAIKYLHRQPFILKF